MATTNVNDLYYQSGFGIVLHKYLPLKTFLLNADYTSIDYESSGKYAHIRHDELLDFISSQIILVSDDKTIVEDKERK